MKITLIVAALLAALVIGAAEGFAGDRGRNRDRQRLRDPDACQQGDRDRDCDPEACDDACRREEGQRSEARRRGSRRGSANGRRGNRGRNNGRRGNGRGRRNGERQRDGGGCDGTGGGRGGGACTSLDDVTSDGTQTVPDEYLARLQFALENELYARDYYEAANTALGGPRMFSNLARAEQNHADAVGEMIRIVGGTAVVEHDIEVVPPTSFDEATGVCEAIELTVIDLYEGLITDCVDDRILAALRAIQASNRRHLAAVD